MKLWALKSLQATEPTEDGAFVLKVTLYSMDHYERHSVEIAMVPDLLEELIGDLTDLARDQKILIEKIRSEGNGSKE